MARPIISRASAQELGLLRYYTGRPCKSGHDCERYTATTNCVLCKGYRPRAKPLPVTEPMAFRGIKAVERVPSGPVNRSLGSAFPVDLSRLMAGR